MTQPKAPSALHTKLDAWQRAVRTFFAGLAAAVVVAVVPTALILIGEVKFTRSWGEAALVTLATVALNAVSSYVTRYVKAPNLVIPPSNQV